MKINLNDYDLSEFNVIDGIFCNIPSTLITPKHIGVKWTKENAIFRSSIWSKENNELLSAGLKKFTNLGENPEHFPVPLNVDGVKFVTKIDGSLCPVDFVNGQLNMRTRGTFNYQSMENAIDFEFCLNNHPKIIEWLKGHSNYTLLFEITTPNMKVILDYSNEPKFWLVGCVNKDNYSLMPQDELDKLAIELNVLRPESFSFETIDECINTIKTWDGKEGVCIYHHKGQEIHKVKAEIYLKLHRFKSEATLDNTVELFVEYGRPSYNDFIAKLTAQYDFECMQMVLPFASIVVDANKEANKIVEHMANFVEKNKHLTRKDFAQLVFSSYGGEKNSRASFLFSILDRGALKQEQIKKLVYQCLK